MGWAGLGSSDRSCLAPERVDQDGDGLLAAGDGGRYSQLLCTVESVESFITDLMTFRRLF